MLLNYLSITSSLLCTLNLLSKCFPCLFVLIEHDFSLKTIIPEFCSCAWRPLFFLTTSLPLWLKFCSLEAHCNQVYPSCPPLSLLFIKFSYFFLLFTWDVDNWFTILISLPSPPLGWDIMIAPEHLAFLLFNTFSSNSLSLHFHGHNWILATVSVLLPKSLKQTSWSAFFPILFAKYSQSQDTLIHQDSHLLILFLSSNSPFLHFIPF